MYRLLSQYLFIFYEYIIIVNLILINEETSMSKLVKVTIEVNGIEVSSDIVKETKTSLFTAPSEYLGLVPRSITEQKNGMIRWAKNGMIRSVFCPFEPRIVKVFFNNGESLSGNEYTDKYFEGELL